MSGRRENGVQDTVGRAATHDVEDVEGGAISVRLYLVVQGVQINLSLAAAQPSAAVAVLPSRGGGGAFDSRIYSEDLAGGYVEDHIGRTGAQVVWNAASKIAALHI